MTTKSTKVGVFCGSLQIAQMALDESATVDVRRVKPEGDPEHVQLSVTCRRHHRHRTDSHSFCFTLTPAMVETLIVALTKLHPPYDRARDFQSFLEREAEDRKFYGLDR
jgi:hypothetical protein